MKQNLKKTGEDKPITCSIERSVAIIGSKWTLLIIRDLLTGTKRFGELEKSLSSISPRTLSLRLKELEENNIVNKKTYPSIPPKTEYTLTNKGRALVNILDQMAKWSESYL